MKKWRVLPTFSTRSKLSKRKGAQEILEYRTRGIYPESIVNLLTQAGGGFTSGTISQTSRLHPIDELIDDFDVSFINRNSCQLNVPKLDDYNRQALKVRLQSPTEKTAFVADARKMVQEKYATDAAESVVVHVVDWALQSRLTNINDLFTPDMAFVWTRKSADSEILGMDENLLMVVVKAMEELPDGAFNRTEIAKRLRSVAGENGVDFKTLMKVLRWVVSGTARGPSIAEMAEILGRTEFTARVKDALPRRQKEAVISGWVSEIFIGFFSRNIFLFFFACHKMEPAFFHEYFPVIRSITNRKKSGKKKISRENTHTRWPLQSVTCLFRCFPLKSRPKEKTNRMQFWQSPSRGCLLPALFHLLRQQKKCTLLPAIFLWMAIFPLDCVLRHKEARTFMPRSFLAHFPVLWPTEVSPSFFSFTEWQAVSWTDKNAVDDGESLRNVFGFECVIAVWIGVGEHDAHSPSRGTSSGQAGECVPFSRHTGPVVSV